MGKTPMKVTLPTQKPTDPRIYEWIRDANRVMRDRLEQVIHEARSSKPCN